MNFGLIRAGHRLLLPGLVVFSCSARCDMIYDASVAEDLSTLTVTAHFAAPAPEALNARDDSAGSYLNDFSIDG